MWYQQFDLRHFKILRDGRPIVDFDCADKCRLHNTTKEGMNFQDGIPSIPIDILEDHYVLVHVLNSMQDGTKNFCYPEQLEKPLRLELNLTVFLQDVTELVVLAERTCSVAVDKYGVVGKKI